MISEKPRHVPTQCPRDALKRRERDVDLAMTPLADRTRRDTNSRGKLHVGNLLGRLGDPQIARHERRDHLGLTCHLRVTILPPMALSSPYRSITQTKRVISDTLLRVIEDHRIAVGKKLLALRKSKNMTQMDAAIACDVELKTWGDWERGKRDPYDRNWRKIGEVFDVNPAEIRGTPPAPLGLGAREDQVEDVRDEFRVLVEEHNTKLDDMKNMLDDAHLERGAIQALIDQQNANLGTQTGVLREIQATQSSIQTTLRGQTKVLKDLTQTVKELTETVALLPALREALQAIQEAQASTGGGRAARRAKPGGEERPGGAAGGSRDTG